MRGRKPEPTHLRLLRQNPGNRPVNANEAEVEPGAAPPDWLTGDALGYWKPLSDQLDKAGLLSTVDAEALGLYCESVAEYAEASKQVKKFGRVIKSPSGYPMQSPWVSIRNKAHEQMLKLQQEFGKTPSARSRISAKPRAGKKGTTNPFLDMVRKRQAG